MFYYTVGSLHVVTDVDYLLTLSLCLFEDLLSSEGFSG